MSEKNTNRDVPDAVDLGFESVNDMEAQINEAVSSLGIQLRINWLHPRGYWVTYIEKLEGGTHE